MAAYNYEQNLTCIDYFQVVTDEAEDICKNFDFKKLHVLQEFAAATWYNQDDCNVSIREQWEYTTGLTTA